MTVRSAAAGCAVLAVALLLAEPCVARDASGPRLLAVVSQKTAATDALVAAARSAAAGALRVLRMEVGAASTDACAYELQQTGLAGVLAVGDEACALARKVVVPGTPVVLCSYRALNGSGAPGAAGAVQALSLTLPLAANLTLLRALAPGARTVAVLHVDPDVGRVEAEALAACGARRPEARFFRIESWALLRERVEEALTWGDALWVPADPALTPKALAHMLERCLARGKPAFAASPRVVRGGALAGLMPEPAALGRAAGAWLAAGGGGAGGAGGGLPAQAPRVVVNPRVAAFLKLALPASVVDGLPVLDVAQLTE